MATAIRKLGPEAAGMLLSRKDFSQADCQAPFIYERVRGRLVVMSPAGPEHRKVSRLFRRALGGYWHLHPEIVEDVDIEGWVATSSDIDLIPDICVYLVGSSPGQTVPHRVSDLIFEFVSADRSNQEREYSDKRIEYHAIGVKEYVIVDRFKQTALVLNWRVGGYEERWLGRQDEYSAPRLPRISVALREVFS